MSTETRFEDGKLHVTRRYDAPREAVFDAWVETSKVQQWWGCAQTTKVCSEIEPRVGGKYNHTMTIEGAGEYPGQAVLVEFEPPARLAYKTANPMDPNNVMVVRVEFREVDGGTFVELIHEGIPDIRVEGDVEMREIIRAGWTAAFGKLDKFLRQPS